MVDDVAAIIRQALVLGVTTVSQTTSMAVAVVDSVDSEEPSSSAVGTDG